MPPRNNNAKKRYNSHRKFRLSNTQFDNLIQSRDTIKNSSKSTISLKENWKLAYKCGSRFQTNPVGARSRPFLVSIYQTTYPNNKLSHKIIAQEKSNTLDMIEKRQGSLIFLVKKRYSPV